jgi:hypothetical protein
MNNISKELKLNINKRISLLVNDYISEYINIIMELKIRKNSNIPCGYFYKFILTREELLKKIAPNEKYIKRKCLRDK